MNRFPAMSEIISHYIYRILLTYISKISNLDLGAVNLSKYVLIQPFGQQLLSKNNILVKLLNWFRSFTNQHKIFSNFYCTKLYL